MILVIKQCIGILCIDLFYIHTFSYFVSAQKHYVQFQKTNINYLFIISFCIHIDIIYDLLRRHPDTCNKFDELNTQKPKELFEEYYSISSQYDPYIDAYNGAEDG